MSKIVTFIHTADLHQGIDFSTSKFKKGIKQRSDDFLHNFNIIIDRSDQTDIDFIVIAGDIFDRSKPKPLIKTIIVDKLIKLSQKKPVIIIPGNHDKSRFNKGLLFLYSNLFIINKPSVLDILIKDIKISITGIPFVREDTLRVIKSTISKSIRKNSDFTILVLHELIESCKVGYMNFEFTKNMKKVIPISLIDQKFDYIALGHVHKYQKIEKASTPIYYSGSVERTSVVERNEEKGYLIVKVFFKDNLTLNDVQITFNPLPTRKMIYYKILSLIGFQCDIFLEEIKEKISHCDLNPLVIINIANLDNYEKYRIIRDQIRSLKTQGKIFGYSITSPNFTTKLKRLSKIHNYS